jgi:hypothetical protein
MYIHFPYSVWRVILVGCLCSWFTWQSRKFPPTKINAYSIQGMRPKTSWKHVQPFFSISKQQLLLSSADGVFITNIILSHAICPSFFAEVAWWQRKLSKIESAYRLHHHLHSAAPLDWTAVTKFKLKINSEGFLWFSTKISTPKITPHNIIVRTWTVWLTPMY